MKKTLLLLFVFVLLSCPLFAGDYFKLGIIGLDTIHVIEFTNLINDPNNNYFCRVVAGYPGHSDDIEISRKLWQKYTDDLRTRHKIQICDTPEQVVELCDGILIESVDGRPHLVQARPAILAKKPLFIDKPLAASLEDAIEIFKLAEDNNVMCWSASSLRFSPGIANIVHDPNIGQITGCDAFSPCPLDPHHPDLYWYGIHGVEPLYTIMGTGCVSVSRTYTDGTELVVGKWKDGRIGTFRGIRQGKGDFGAYVFGTKGHGYAGPWAKYKPLVDEVVKAFETGEIPVSHQETIEILAFMTAADVSRKSGGAEVTIESVLKKAGGERYIIK